MRLIAEGIVVISVLAIVYALLGYLAGRRQLSTMTMVERAQAVIEESRVDGAKPKRLDFVRLYLIKQGFGYGLNIAFIGWLTIYVGAMLVLKVCGLPFVAAAVAGMAVASIAIWIQLSRLATARRRLFNRQFLDAMKLIANQLSAGSGPQRAIEQVIPSLSDPVRSELSAAMDSALVSKDMVSALSELRDRYPSDAITLFVTALELNRDSNAGGRLEPTIRRASEVMAKNFELGDEAVTEITQVRAEFFAVLGVIGLIAAVLFESGGAGAHTAYTSAVGIIFLIVAFGWAAFGSALCIRMFNKARGDT